jgi:hypothetical protein
MSNSDSNRASMRRLDDEYNRSGIDLLARIPKISNLLGISTSGMNQLNMYKMKLKLANQEIDELK